MQCKEIQVCLSVGDTLSELEKDHLGGCHDCLAHQESVLAAESFASSIGNQAPSYLKERIRSRLGKARSWIPLKQIGFGFASVFIIASPVVLYVMDHIGSKRSSYSGEIGNWPTYHSVTLHYALHPENDTRAERVEEIDEVWVQGDAARSQRRVGNAVIEDIVIKEEDGLPVLYKLTPKGKLTRTDDSNGYVYTPDFHVKQVKRASKSFSPFPDDPKWLVDIPRNFKGVSVSSPRLGTFRLVGADVPVTFIRVESASRESMAVLVSNQISHKLLSCDHYDTVRDIHGKVVANRAKDYSESFDYDHIDARQFDQGTLVPPPLTFPAMIRKGK